MAVSQDTGANRFHVSRKFRATNADGPLGDRTLAQPLPGYIAMPPSTVKTHVLTLIPLNRFGDCEDVAAAVAFIASPEAKYITGQVLTVDGGMAM